MQLGFDHHLMLLDQVMPALCKALKSRSQPNILFLHLGENNLLAYSMVQLLKHLSLDIAKIKHLMPRTRLDWANMPPRHVWDEANSNKAINLARRNANKQISKITGRNHRVVITHPGIHYGFPHIF